MVFRSANPS